MSSPLSEAQYLAELKAFFADPDNQGLMQEMFTALPDEMQQWLGKASLFYGVPFNNLVVDDRMLPTESLRFFHVDHNWLDAMIDGVFSIGVHSSRNAALLNQVITAIREIAEAEQQLQRQRLRRLALPAEVEIGGPVTGLLLRSAAVSGWPGLEVKAFQSFSGSPPAGVNPLPLLRMDRLAADVLLCLFAGVPTRVEINEPSEGLHFGIEDDDLITLRGLGFNNHAAGVPLGETTITASYRQANGQNTRVLDVFATQTALASALNQQGALPPTPPFGPAAFAIQMVQAPEQQGFDHTGN